MKRLTTDSPQGNFETILNYVFSKDGWAHIRSDGNGYEPMQLTDWARKQCIARGCDWIPEAPEAVDGVICDCAFGDCSCPVFLAYTFASQAVHMRDRLKAIEDILGDDYDLDHLRELVQTEKDGRLVVLPENKPYSARMAELKYLLKVFANGLADGYWNIRIADRISEMSCGVLIGEGKDEKPVCFYNGTGSEWCPGLAKSDMDDEPIELCKLCRFLEANQGDAEVALERVKGETTIYE